MSGIFLSEAERAYLVSAHRSEKDSRVADRIKAVLLYDKGWTMEEIAEALLLTHQSISKHIRDYQSNRKLKPGNGGSVAKLTEAQRAELSAHLNSHTYSCSKDVCSYVKNKYGVTYTSFGMIKLLHRLGFSYKKPKLIPGKVDAEKQEEWKEQYTDLKSSLRSDECIYFMDSVHPQYQARARCGWIKKNQSKTLPIFSGWKRKHIIGAINISNLNLVNSEKDKVNGDKIIEFLGQLEQSEPDKRTIYLICDNAGYHKSKKVKEYLEKSRIKLIFLPTYSPNLNPIERLWKYMHRIVSNNKWYDQFKHFSSAIDRFFENISIYRHALSSLINDNFQKITINHICNSSG